MRSQAPSASLALRHVARRHEKNVCATSSVMQRPPLCVQGASLVMPQLQRRQRHLRLRLQVSASLGQAPGEPSAFGKEDPFRFPPGLGGLGPDDLPTQGRAVVEGTGGTMVAEREKDSGDLDYLSELMAITQQDGPRNIGFFGTRNMGFSQQQLIEILSYAMVLTNNHIFTSGATGTNAAVIRGALRAEKPELLTVVLPQSLSRQPPESQELLLKVMHVVEAPQNDDLPLLEASRLCNEDILGRVQQVICFAFHDSRVLLETINKAREMRKIVSLFFLD